MLKFNPGLHLIAAVILVILAVLYRETHKTGPVKVSPAVITGEVAEPVSLEKFTDQLMANCNVKSSDGRKAILINQLNRISKRVFNDRRSQESFLFLVCIESKFDTKIVSKAGAVGLTQLMPKYAAEFATGCGLGKVDTGDLYDSEVNLTIGACLFRQHLDHYNGNIALALAAYNSGLDSPTVKKLNALAPANTETTAYLAKYVVLQQKMGGN